jgi:diguanylate cyclase (GGDEF)-like protein
MLLGLDHFSAINSEFGQDGGDTVLDQVERRLIDCLREGDTLIRLHGDRFCILAAAPAERKDLALVARRTLRALAQPFLFDVNKIQLTASIGISCGARDDGGPDQIAQRVETALRYAKEHGRNVFHFYSPELDLWNARDRSSSPAAVEHRLALLTPREREVLALVVDGKASKMIAYLLGTSIRTIDNQRASIMRKMQAGSLAQLVGMILGIRR